MLQQTEFDLKVMYLFLGSSFIHLLYNINSLFCFFLIDPFCLFHYIKWIHFRFITYFNIKWKNTTLFNTYTFTNSSEIVAI